MSRSVQWLVLLAVLGAGCGSMVAAGVDAGVGPGSDAGFAVDSGAADAGAPDAGLEDAGVFDAGLPDAGVTVPDAGMTADSGLPDSGLADAGVRDAGGGSLDAGLTYVRGSLSGCWRNVNCQRVFSIAHGGSWTASIPYDSNGAIAASYADGTDGVKIDVRVTSDNVPVISHSSPIELFESIDCYNRRIENMTAAQVTACHRVPSTTERFQRLDDVLNYLRGKMVVQLTVKRSVDFARTIQEIHALQAEDFAFIELNAQELTTLIPTIPGGNTVSYVVNAASNVNDVDVVIAANNPLAFIVEFDPPVNVAPLLPTKLRPNNLRSFTYTNAPAPTTVELKALFDKGFDIVSSQNGPNGVAARQQVNTMRGVTPP